MTVCAFIGSMDEDDTDIPDSGTGKTCSMVGFAYLDYKKDWVTWSNFKIDFSEKVIGVQKMIELLNKFENSNEMDFKLNLLVTEFQDVLDACGSKTKEILFMDYFIRQMRKIGRDKGEVNLFWDNQRYMSIQKRVRSHTNKIFIPFKTHMDNSPCKHPKCKKEHKIYVYSQRPFYENPVKIFNPQIIGQHYDTYQIVHDVLHIPTKQELKNQEFE